MKTAVVIPLYNHRDYIVPALRSVLEQSRPPEKIVVVDDGSSDDSAAQVEQLGEKRIELIRQENQGAHAALNHAVERAQPAELVAILNSDDCYLPTRLERCAAHLDAHPGVQLLVTQLQLIGSSGEILANDDPRHKWFQAIWSWQETGVPLHEWLALGNFAGTTSNFVARRQWLLQNPFQPYRYVHDYYALNLAALDNALGLLNEPLLQYRVHPANTITTAPSKLILEVLGMHADLARALAPRMKSDPGLAQRWCEYLRRAWMNVSSFRADLFARLATEALADADRERIQQWIDSFQDLPQASQHPNRAMVNRHAGQIPLGPESGLSEAYEALREDFRRLKAVEKNRKQWDEIQRLAGCSRWLALGRLLGGGKGIFQHRPSQGTDPAEALQRLAASPWLRLGKALGSPSCRKLAEQRPSDRKRDDVVD